MYIFKLYFNDITLVLINLRLILKISEKPYDSYFWHASAMANQ